ncbi:hypothetical protein ASG01_05255 [Chryseobacterium sp. Leaf180]|uniref:glycine zipper family protein n=1 Tax=Chryseobacterium sp. Leaf180 TaxID=1736289 RepID=UPI0006FDAA14|nr:glycine zipper family protein [Chryseobacterium sp. Leaf180]KQR95257.1 hypothetical protein ASG01_05255 [Chryseobacterium sp. Leaf180]
MKKLIIFLFITSFFSAQKTEKIKFNKNIKNEFGSYRGFMVLDQRDSQDIGIISSNSEPTKIVFENEDVAKGIKDWFYEYNSLKTGDQLVLMLEKIKISETKKEKFSEGKLELQASTFLKKPDGYYFLKKKDTVVTVTSDFFPNMAQNLSRKTTAVLADLFQKSYTAKTWQISLQESELPNYTAILKSKAKMTNSTDLKDGVYEDSHSFFTNNPLSGYEIKTNKQGIVKRAEKGYDVKSIHRFYAFVYQGKMYKMVPAGYAEIKKQNEVYQINVTYDDLFPPKSGNYTVYGAIAGGLVGAAIGAMIDSGRTPKGTGGELTLIGLDPLTGNYILPEDFGKQTAASTDKK